MTSGANVFHLSDIQVEAGPLEPGDRVWIPGHSPVSGRTGQLERQLEILGLVPVPPPVIAMLFHVPS